MRNPFDNRFTDKFKEVPIAEKSPEELEKIRNNKEAGVITTSHPTDSDGDDSVIDSDLQAGIKQIEAITTVWSKSHLIAAYVLIWIIMFIDSVQQSMGFSFLPFVTSSFALHSLTATTNVVSGILGGLVKLPLAKVLDIWGRPTGFLAMVFCMIIGLIMMAACQNVATFFVAQCFYWIGYNGISYTLSIFVADTSHLKNRGLMFAVIASPYIITVWIGGPVATSFLNGAGWRWGYGTFAIVSFVMCMPLYALFQFNYLKAKKQGLITPKEHTRTTLQTIKYYAIEFDIAGVFILCAGLSLFLLPFTLQAYQGEGWKSPMIIGMIVAGFVLCIIFALFEKYVAPKTFMPFQLLTDRTVLGACILSAIIFIQFYIWSAFFSSFLMVVNHLDVTETSYVRNIYSIGSCAWSFVVGFLIRYTGRFKWQALYFGVPVTILGVSLMIHFRAPDTHIGYIVMCQIFIAISGGTLVICLQMAAMAATTHQYLAVVIAVEGMFSSIGGAIGSTVSGAIWQGIFPNRLQRYLPEEISSNATAYAMIYADISTQLSYEIGSPTRNAIERSYGDAQRLMLIASSVLLVGAIASVMVWRDIKVTDFKQVKGRVV